MSNYLKNKRDTSTKLEVSFEEFKTLLKDKTHPDNQTDAYRKNVLGTLNRLVVAADEADALNPGEGIFSLMIISSQ